ncbi:hypothetical protein V6N11_032871 [Hibiscus sabdariffa]|uniref:Uncharacterized protein n=1 Tax=Hibiscus sabdariffa TaxID=183260 RepID=A0ABR2T200_9ROSI
MARFSHGFGCFVHGLCSQLCESKVRPPFGRRVESLDLPSPGGRNLGRHCRQDWNKAHGGGANGRCYVCTHFLFILQDLARWLAPSGQYKVSDGFNTGFGETRELCSDGSVGVYSWLVRTIWVQGGSLIRERSDGGELQESQRGNGEPTGKTRSQKVEEGRRWRRKRSKGKIKREMMNVLRYLERQLIYWEWKIYKYDGDGWWHPPCTVVMKISAGVACEAQGTEGMTADRGTFSEYHHLYIITGPAGSLFIGMMASNYIWATQNKRSRPFKSTKFAGNAEAHVQNRQCGGALSFWRVLITLIKAGYNLHGLHRNYVNRILWPGKREKALIVLQKAKINLRGGLSQQRRERFSENREAKQNSIMAYEVTGLLENLKFSEEELVDVSNMDDEILTEMDGSDKWVVEHTLESQEEEGRGGAQEGRWKMPSTSTVRPRAVKRTLKGKNEVCHPITSKKRKTVNTTLGEEDEFSKATSPIKLSAQMVEAGSQPRREP